MGRKSPMSWPVYTAKTKYRNFETNIPRKEISGSQSQFPHSCVCERFIYSHDRSLYSAGNMYVDRSWDYKNRSQTHECWNWGWGRAIPRKGIHKGDFPCSVLHRLDYAESKITDILIDRYMVTTDPDKKPYPGVEENLFLWRTLNKHLWRECIYVKECWSMGGSKFWEWWKAEGWHLGLEEQQRERKKDRER